jgi:FkbM family methyltransferase
MRENFLGLSAFRENAARRFAALCNSNDIEVVFDVGANVGQFVLDLRRHCYKKNIVSFEPVSETYTKLLQNFRNDHNWHGLQKGVGKNQGELLIILSANSGLSTSFLDMEASHLENFPQSKFVGTETVQVTTISDQIKNFRIDASKLAIKIDVQGFELDVLRGAIGDLKGVRCLLIEASLIPLYVGEPSLKELLEFLDLHGHKVVDVFRGIKGKDGNLLQVDLITLNTNFA